MTRSLCACALRSPMARSSRPPSPIGSWKPLAACRGRRPLSPSRTRLPHPTSSILRVRHPRLLSPFFQPHVAAAVAVGRKKEEARVGRARGRNDGRRGLRRRRRRRRRRGESEFGYDKYTYFHALGRKGDCNLDHLRREDICFCLRSCKLRACNPRRKTRELEGFNSQ